MAGLAAAAADAGVLRIEPHQRAELHGKHRMLALRCLELERGLVAVAAELGAAGVDFVVLKGPALARCFYDDPSWRPFGDFDVLVRRSQWRRALSVVAGCGYRRSVPEPRLGFDERFGKSATHRNDRSLQLDLHTRLAEGEFGMRMELDPLFDRSVPMSIGATEVRRLDDTMLFIHACLHASVGSTPVPPLAIRDVVQLTERARIDFDEVAALAARWRLEAVIDLAAARARSIGFELGGDADRLARRLRPQPRDRRSLAAYAAGRRSAEASTLRSVPGVVNKGLFLWTMLFPTREFLRARTPRSADPSYSSRLAVPLRRLSRRLRNPAA